MRAEERRVEGRLAALGIALPAAAAPGASYIQACAGGRLVFLAGNDPIRPKGGPAGGARARGIIGADVPVAAARAHARLAGLQLLGVIKQHLGDLDRVARVVKVFGLLRTVAGFAEHETVMDGCSELFVQAFGDAGRHARTSVGVPSLYSGMTIEIEAVVEASAAE